MTTAIWFISLGLVLLVVGFTSSYIKKGPATPAIVYLLIGIVVGSMGFNFNPLQESALLELLTEIAVLISLYCSGVKMPGPVTFSQWRTPIQLAVFSAAVALRHTELKLAGGGQGTPTLAYLATGTELQAKRTCA